MKINSCILFNLLFIALISVFSCHSDHDEYIGSSQNVGIERPHSPWVFRSVLDSMPRMITLALNEKMWAAYSTQDCKLYKVWRGFVNFDGAVYNTVHGPQPNTIGDAFISNAISSPWFVINGDKKEIPNVKYKGHEFKNGQVSLHYELGIGNDRYIQVKETPEYLTKSPSGNGFERRFKVESDYPNLRVGLQLKASSISDVNKKDGSLLGVDTNGEFKITHKESIKKYNLSALHVEGELLLNNDQATFFNTHFVSEPLINNKNKLKDEAALDKPLGYKLIARNDCKSCHNTYRKTIGPSYDDIALRYANTPANIEMLTQKVKAGGSGAWGQVMMNAHPNVPSKDIKEMISYIMSLDLDTDQGEDVNSTNDPKELSFLDGLKGVVKEDYLPGVLVKVIKIKRTIKNLNDIDFNKRPKYEGVIPKVDLFDGDLGWAGNWFAMQFDGFIKIEKDNNYIFRLISDDGSRLYVDDQLVIDNDGFHGSEARDGELALKEGLHPFKVQFFQGGGGKNVQLLWNSFDKGVFKAIPRGQLAHHKTEQAPRKGVKAPPITLAAKVPGDTYPLKGVHPSYDLSTARPATFLPKVGGMDFLTDGTMVVSTWDAGGEVHLITNATSGDPEKMKVQTIASGLAEPLGLKVVNNAIYVLQKQELTKLIDHDGDGIIDEYLTINNDWDVSANFHEFAFGLVEKDGWLYGNLAIGILPGGASAPDQPTQRGSVFRVELASGAIEYVANGLRTPNGIGIGVDEEIFVADNQGDWLPASKIVHVQKDAWYGSRAVDFAGTANRKETLPVVWLPQDEIGNSPTQITYIKDGPYKGQMIHGDVTHGGLKRVFAEKVNGDYQGVVFRFMQGLEAGVNRIVHGPDRNIYVGGIGSTGNWQQNGKYWYGLQQLKYNGKSTFEMLAVRAKSDGIEIEFTEPLKIGSGLNLDSYSIKQWRYEPTASYGGPKLDKQDLKIKEISISPNRKRVFLQTEGMSENHMLYIHLNELFVSKSDNSLLSTEAWYTLNQIPSDQPGDRNEELLSSTWKMNQLTPDEK